MTPLYFDTYAGCTDNYAEWTIEDEGKKNLIDLVKGLFR